jgi:hypothetical protein
MFVDSFFVDDFCRYCVGKLGSEGLAYSFAKISLDIWSV